jgi:DNA-binding LytR/AlgR family response regulator
VHTPVIFTTAYDKYAVKAFELNSVSYLLKPVRRSDLQSSLEKFKSLRSAFGVDFDYLQRNIQGNKNEYKKRFIVKVGSLISKIEASDVAYIYSMEKSTFLRAASGKNYPLDLSLDNLEKLLDPAVFFRVNRKYIVNINAISRMFAYSRGRVKLFLYPNVEDDMEVIVSVERSGAFKKWLDR